MPRTLPWLKPGAASTKSKPTASRPRKAPNTAITSSSFTSTAISTTRPHPPPTDPTDGPPIEYMLPGDDLWVMVEDELLSTANLYTRAIHLDEYKKLQVAAARHIPRVSRSTVGADTVSEGPHQRRRGRKRSREKPEDAEAWVDREEGMRRLLDDDDDDEGHLATGGQELRGLMRRDTTRGRQSLGRWMKQQKVSTRAAAGLKDSEVKEGGAWKKHADMMRERSPDAEESRRNGVKALEAVREETDGGTSDDDLGAVSVRRKASAVSPTIAELEERRPARMKSISNRRVGSSSDAAPNGTAASEGGKEKKERKSETAAKLIDDGFDFFETFAVPVVKTRFRGRAPAAAASPDTNGNR